MKTWIAAAVAAGLTFAVAAEEVKRPRSELTLEPFGQCLTQRLLKAKLDYCEEALKRLEAAPDGFKDVRAWVKRERDKAETQLAMGLTEFESYGIALK